MKVSLVSVLITFFCITSCKEQESVKKIDFNQEALIHDLKVISHDSMAGRAFGATGNYKAQRYIASRFDSLGISPAFSNGNVQKFRHTLKGKKRLEIYPLDKMPENISDTTLVGGNVVVKIKGASKKLIVVTAHLDHLGIQKGKIYNGADDNASGVSALIAIADYFKDKPLNHTLLLAAVDAEEIGSHGAEYLLQNFPLDTELIALNINMDMIAHNHSSELYASGLYHYPFLKKPLDKIETNIDLLYGHDEPNKKNAQDWTFSSDHRVFHKRKIPFIYFGVEDHKNYHKPTDTFQNINSEFYIEAVSIVIQAIENLDSFLMQNGVD